MTNLRKFLKLVVHRNHLYQIHSILDFCSNTNINMEQQKSSDIAIFVTKRIKKLLNDTKVIVLRNNTITCARMHDVPWGVYSLSDAHRIARIEK